MARSKPRIDTDLPDAAVKSLEIVRADDDALMRMLDRPFDQSWFGDEPQQSERMEELLGFILRSLQRASASARANAAEGQEFHRGSGQKAAELDASMRETRRLIEELIHGG